MSKINLARFAASIACVAACSFVVLLFVGCDLGTYSERVQSNGGTLPVTTVSQDSGSDSKANGTKANGSDAKGAASNTKDAGSDTKDAGSGKKKMTSLSDIQRETDEKRRRELEADGR